MIRSLQREDFARAEHQTFDIWVGEATVTMTGIEPYRTPQGPSAKPSR